MNISKGVVQESVEFSVILQAGKRLNGKASLRKD
jgi:hypothetical protein